MKKLIALLSLSLVVVTTGCSMAQRAANGSDGTPGEPGTNFNVLKQEGYGGRSKASNEVIDSQEELNSLYKELSLTDVPSIDFKKQKVVALFMGKKSTGGYSIGISSVVVKNNIATVLVKNMEPAADAMVTNALTAPYCIAAITKADKVVFE